MTFLRLFLNQVVVVDFSYRLFPRKESMKQKEKLMRWWSRYLGSNEGSVCQMKWKSKFFPVDSVIPFNSTHTCHSLIESRILVSFLLLLFEPSRKARGEKVTQKKRRLVLCVSDWKRMKRLPHPVFYSISLLDHILLVLMSSSHMWMWMWMYHYQLRKCCINKRLRPRFFSFVCTWQRALTFIQAVIEEDITLSLSVIQFFSPEFIGETTVCSEQFGRLNRFTLIVLRRSERYPGNLELEYQRIQLRGRMDDEEGIAVD